MADHRENFVRLREEAMESAAEQRALMMSFEMQRQDESA
jgi:hypothetical protein